MEKTTRILAVDDSVTIRKALELILIPAGYQVEFAVNGAEAIDKAKQLQPDILLLDFILPDMRGTEVCRELLADPQTRSIPVVLISARGAEIRQAYHDVENVLDYLTKPFTPEAVLGVLREVLTAQATRTAPAAPIEAALPPMTLESDSASAPSAAPAVPADLVEVGAEAAAAAAAEDIDDDEVAAPPPARPKLTRGDLESMFETLRAGLEGVYVEEMDTPAGAAVDQARSYTDLASRLARQLGETLEQAETRQRFRLYGDGSIRSLDESLLDTYRRVCRLLFRAAAAGAVGDDAVARSRPRLLIVSPRDSDSYERLAALDGDAGDAHVLLVASDYRQLPMLVRLYAPTHLVVDAGRSAAIWDQVRLLRSLPEARRLEILAVAGAEGIVPASAGVHLTVDAGPGLQEAIRHRLAGREPAAESRLTPTPPALASGM